MLEIGKIYQVKITNSIFNSLTANETKSIRVDSCLVLVGNGTNSTRIGTLGRWVTQMYTNITRIDVSGDGTNGSIILYNEETVVETLRKPLVALRSIVIYLLFNCLSITNPTAQSSFDDNAIEIPTTNRIGLTITNSIDGGKIRYDNDDYDSIANVIPIHTPIANERFDLIVNENHTLYGKELALNVVTDDYVQGFNQASEIVKTYLRFDITSTLIDSFDYFVLSTIVPFGDTSNLPYSLISFSAPLIQEHNVSIESNEDYSVNEIESGIIEEITTGQDSTELIMTAKGDNHFVDGASSLIGEVITGNRVNTEITFDGINYHIRLIGVYGAITFTENEAIKDYIVMNPTLTKTIVGGSVVEESSFAYLEPYEVTITPTLSGQMYEQNRIVVTMNGETITPQIIFDENGGATIKIQRVTGSVFISALPSPKYKIVANLSDEEHTTIYSITPKFDIKFDVRVVDNVHQVRFNDGVWVEVTLSEHQVIKGLGIDNVVYIPSNINIRNYDISRYTESRTFNLYIITREEVEPTSFELDLYKMTGERNIVDKTDVLTIVGTLVGTLREASSIISPIITIEYDEVPNFNYVYIPNFNRYYYVTEITNIRNKLWNIALRVDVLMSFKEEIRSQSCIVARNEFDFNPLVEDNERLKTGRQIVESIDIHIENEEYPFNNDELLNPNTYYVLEYMKGRFLYGK